jgi:Chromo (CHRromatin Organisation MOdifier) domain
LLDKKKTPDGVEYLVKWENYSVQEATWIPFKELRRNCLEMVKIFNRKHKQ